MLRPRPDTIGWDHVKEDAGTGTGDNYAYLVVDEKTQDAAIIDPANPSEYGSISHHLAWGGPSLTGP